MRLDLQSIRSTGTADLGRSLLSEWRVGAILQAIAVRDPRNGELWLNVGNQRFPARLASGNGQGPADGEVLTLRVLRNSPVLALETVDAPANGSATAVDDPVTSDALRRHVPRQASPAPLMSNLGWIARGNGGAESLPVPVAQAVNRLWQALPDTQMLTDPKGLQSAIARSGTFLEAALAGKATDSRPTSAAVVTDLKALMLDLSRVLRDHGARPASAMTDSSPAPAPVPGAHGPLASLPAAPATLAVLDTPNQQMNELARQTEGALSRLTTVQITNTGQDPTVQSMLFELPVRHEDRASMVRLRINRDGARRNGSSADSWTVEAAMDLGAIGALHARVTLQGHRIGVQLRAESPGVVETLSRRSGELESLLREAGLEVDRVVCLHGMPAGETGTRLTRLLDVRA
jgi:hypothetical protein